jgi:hypothetical protein
MNDDKREAVAAILSQILKRGSDEQQRKMEILDTIHAHHGEDFTLAAVAVLEEYDAGFKLLTIMKMSKPPEVVMKVYLHTLADLIGTANSAQMLLAAKAHMPNSTDAEREAEAKKVQALLEPLVRSGLDTSLAVHNKVADLANKLFDKD